MAPESGVFDPFTNRLSRDLRNSLSGALLSALTCRDQEPFESVARTLREQNDLSQTQADYLTDRLDCYRSILAQTAAGLDPNRDALLLWNHELFFEFHELLEKRWLAASGVEKEVLQALIRAAGTYVHRRQGHAAGAVKMAARAREAIARHRDYLPPGFDAATLLAALADPSAPPPVFGAVSLPLGNSTCRHRLY